MTEKTRSIIKKYQEELPHAQEKIAMAGIMLLVAVLVSCVATYAWISLSRAPAVSSITTTISSNGSLEIGLAGEDGSQPEEFDIDESSSFETDVMKTNRLWGNIINLADDRYGFSELILRPARLNSSNIKNNPLKGVEYGTDGRIETLSTDFIYSAFDGHQFVYSKDKGVRAISSYEEGVLTSTEQKRKDLEKVVDSKQNAVNTYYLNNVPAKMAALSDMISTYAQEKVNGTEYAPSGATVPIYFSKAHLQSAKGLYDVLYETMELQKEAYIALANYQRFTQYGESYDEITSFDEFYNNPAKYNVDTAAGKSKDGIICLQGLTTFVNDYKALVTDREHFRKYIEDEWAENTYSFNTGGDSGYTINYMIARLIDYSNMYIIYNGTKYKVTELQSLGTGLLDLKDHTYPCYIVNGIMKRFEQIAIQENYRLPNTSTSEKTSIKIAMKVKKIITINFCVYGEAYTEATGDSYFNGNFVAAQSLETQDKDYVAVDTYGMAIDFWVRSNAEKTKLTLAGAVTTDKDGNLLSYDGINRVWGSTGNATLTHNSTTQGGGSCYIYYADSPEDMNSSLLLLRSIKVAFVQTSTGEVLAKAGMDTSNYYAVNGRITVPLVVDDSPTNGVEYTYTDETNSTVTGRAITDLVIDEAKDITAIVYLDGTTLENKHVLAASDIEGQLNIQFGSSQELKTVGDFDLLTAERYVTATASKIQMDFDTAMSPADLTTTVTAVVEGTDPQKIEGYFVRAINASQGQREVKMTFTKQENGEWTCDYTFTTPGNYYLRYLRLDGVDYALPEPINVTVTGFVINSVEWGEGAAKEHTVFTVDSGYKESVTVTYAASDQSKMPKKVSATFERQDGVNKGATVTAELTYKNNKWSGEASFQSSGEYVLKYLVQYSAEDKPGNYVDLATANNGQNDFTRKLTLTLGLTVAVYDNNGTLTEQYDPEEPVGTYYKEVWVRIFDNSGNMITPQLYDDNGQPIEGNNYIPDGVTPVLKYAPGTVDTDLTWYGDEFFDGKSGCFKGELQISKAGRYVFNSVMLGDNVLTRATESPVYVIIPPYPPTYLPEVESDYSGKVQFAPLTNDAYIGPIGIQYAESATLAAYVKNSETGETYPCEQANSSGTAGTIYYGSDNRWYIQLPTYTLDVDEDGKPSPGAAYTQEGVWTVEAITIWDCYDSNSEFITEDKPLLFATSLPANTEAVLVNTDLSAHTTTVSCSINVEVVAAKTELGNTSTTPFMTLWKFSNTGTYVTLTDDAGRTIPKEKVSSSGIKLGLTYNSDDTSGGTYGYVVTGINESNDVSFKFDTSANAWTLDPETNISMRYVGLYKVTSLTVNMKGGNAKTVTAGSNGLPEQYTVRSKGPDATSGIKVVTGNSGNTFSGTFLQSYTPDSWAKVSLVYTDENGDEKDETHVSIDNIGEVKINYTYDWSSKPAEFSWTKGNSSYENISLTMTKNGSLFTSPSTPLLPGKYTQTITVGDNVYTANLKTLNVTAKLPVITIDSVSPLNSTFNMNTATSNDGLKYEDHADLITVQNFKSDYQARVYIKASTYSAVNSITCMKYEAPTVGLKISDIDKSGIAQATFTIKNNANASYNRTFTFTSNNQVISAQIGGIENKNETISSTFGGSYTYYWDNKYEAGDQTISQITLNDINGTSYTATLQNSIKITENHEALPSVTYVNEPGYLQKSGETSTNGYSLTFTLPTVAEFTTKTGTRSETVSSGGEWEEKSKGEELLAYISSCTECKHNVKIFGTSYCYYYDVVFSKYKKVTRVSEQVGSVVDNYSTVLGLLYWEVNGVRKEPGETITVTSAVVARPIIGEISSTLVGRTTTTLIKTETYFESQGTETKTSSHEEWPNSATTLQQAKNNFPGLPSGYSWFEGAGSWCVNGVYKEIKFTPDLTSKEVIVTKET